VNKPQLQVTQNCCMGPQHACDMNSEVNKPSQRFHLESVAKKSPGVHHGDFSGRYIACYRITRPRLDRRERIRMRKSTINFKVEEEEDRLLKSPCPSTSHFVFPHTRHVDRPCQSHWSPGARATGEICYWCLLVTRILICSV
jgi:hypothetical protein